MNLQVRMKRRAYTTKQYMTEQALVDGILHNNEQSLRHYYTAYASKLAAFVRKKIGEEKDVEEIVQDTFLASLEAFRDFTFRCSLSTYLCSIAKRKIVDFYRKRKIKKILFSQAPELESLFAILTTPEDQLNNKLLREHIKQTIGRLKPRYQQIIKLKYVEGFSVVDIAGKLSLSFKTVESSLFRARKDFIRLYSVAYL